MRPANFRSLHVLIVGTALILSTTTLRAENLVFPGKSGVRDVKKEFGAKGDGTTDDAGPINTALKTGSGLYFPNGTYRVTAPLLCNSTPGGGPIIYGQSRDGVIIKLDDGAAGFGTASSPKAVLSAHGIAPGGAISADIFFRQWHNFTVDAGNNAGAIGVRYYSNNSGTLNNVRIIGNGVYGIDMGWTNMNGPCLVQNVVVEGFGVGVYTANGINSQTMSNITIRNSRTLGISASGQNLSIDNLTIENVPTAINASCMLCLVNANFKGSDATKPAIINGANLYCANITTTGFSRAIQSSNGGVAGANVDEFASEAIASSFTGSRQGALRLPIKSSPPMQWEEDTSKWVSVADYGALPGDRYEDSKGFADAIAAAAAAGKTTVYAPPGAYTIVADIPVFGSVRHVVGIGGADAVLTYASGAPPKGFVLRDDAAPLVRISNFGRCAGLTIVSNNTSTLVVDDCVGPDVLAAGRGDVFVNNTVGTMRITNKAAHVWARQWNTEGSALDTDNKGGILWILGLKTENGWTKIATSDSGMTELLGAHIYNICTGPGTVILPLFTVTNASASFAQVRETVFCGKAYTSHVTETRGTTTKPWLCGPRAWALYSAADASFVPPVSTSQPQPRSRAPMAVSPLRGDLAEDAAVFDCRGVRIRPGSAAARNVRASGGMYIVVTSRGARLAVGVRK